VREDRLTLRRAGSIVPLAGVPPAASPVVHGRPRPIGPGKESTTGHWELMGVVLDRRLPTYPHGFPPAVMRALEAATGLRFCRPDRRPRRRPHAPLLAVWAGCDGRRHDRLLADVGASALHWIAGRTAAALPGEPFV